MLKALFIGGVLALALCLVPGYSCAASGTDPVYTIHIGTFSDLIAAGDVFNRLFRKLPDEDKEALRIELHKASFLVRAGRFGSQEDARKVQKNIKRLAPDAAVVRLKPGEAPDQVLIENTVGITRLTARSAKNSPKTASEAVQEDPAAQAETEQEAIDTLMEKISATYQKGQYDEAAVMIRKGLRQWPDRHDLHAWYAATLLDTGNPDKAYEEYRKATELRPTAPEYHAGAGFSLLNIYMDRAKKSISSFEKALSLDPNNSNALEGLGIVYVSIGKQQNAQEMYARLKTVDPAAAARLRDYLAWGIDWSR